MGWFSDDSPPSTYYDEYGNLQEHHEASVTHELLSGAVAYEAAKAYEDHCAENGEPDSHAKAKEIFAGMAGIIIDREVETRGLDWLDRRRVQEGAEQHFSDEYYNRN